MKNNQLCDEMKKAIEHVCTQYGQTTEFQHMLENLLSNMSKGTYNESDLSTLIEKTVIRDGN